VKLLCSNSFLFPLDWLAVNLEKKYRPASDFIIEDADHQPAGIPSLCIEVAYSAEMAKAARLNSNDLAPSQLMSCTTAIRQEGAQRLIFHQPLRFGVRTPCDQIQASSGLSESCPKNADVPKSPFPCSGRPGAVGRHNNT
jgi:hypothetical protein